MSIISPIGRKSLKVRALIAAIYALLILGAVSMIYPFLIMISGSTKSAVDLKHRDAWPRFLSDDLVLYRKHVEGLFNESLDAMNTAYDTEFSSFEKVVPPEQPNESLVREWINFLNSTPLPAYAFTCGYLHAGVSKTIPSALRDFKNEIEHRYGPNIEDVNRALSTDFVGWNAFFVLPGNFLARRSMPLDAPFGRELNAFLSRQPIGRRYYFSPSGYYKRVFLKSLNGKSAGASLSQSCPEEGTNSDWETFVRSSLNLLWIRVDASATQAYRDFLRAKYGTVAMLNQRYDAKYAAFDEIPLIQEPPLTGIALSDWDAFINGWKEPNGGLMHAAPTGSLRIHSVDFLFQDYLKATFETLDRLNAACATRFERFEEIFPPQRDLHYLSFLQERRALRAEFVTRNYKTVLDYMVLHGRGIINTVIYCLLAVLSALIVNPLAAYALSRFKMASTYKWLLFLMLTMAFPPMVTQIPVFLMLREMNLLNTFAALVLPVLANGYSIFLLKGFFDAQPRELYESAAIDGASEWTIFCEITMSLSKPILSVIALNAFVHAYSNFMFALLICQDEKMWTLMVWLYQLQQSSGQPVVYASLLIAAIPTFVVFVFCQRVIIRGIVVPVEK